MRYHKQQYPKANKPVRHEAMMAIKPKHVKTVKYVTRSYNGQVLTVSFGRFELTCMISGKHANDNRTTVSFKHDHGNGIAICKIAGDTKSIEEYCWADETGPELGYYFVKDEAKTDPWGGLTMVNVCLNDCLTVDEYELIRETIAWTWNAIDSGEFEFPQGDAYRNVALKTA